MFWITNGPNNRLLPNAFGPFATAEEAKNFGKDTIKSPGSYSVWGPEGEVVMSFEITSPTFKIKGVE